jgi:acetylornithine deacetylase/succinyl-diaminopimelate desuccinylase-like protein
MVDYITSWFEHRGIETHRVETVPGRPSVIGVLRGSGGAKSLMLNGHSDTVTLATYDNDPLAGNGEEKDGRQVVVGRGSLDMKAGLAAALTSLSAAKANRALRGDVIVAAVADEEDASQGTRDILAAGWLADAAVIPEPTMLTLATAHKGFVWVEVDILGVAAHGSQPPLGVDSIPLAGSFLRALEEYQKSLPVDELLGQASLHCSLIRGGQEPSSYPAVYTVTIECRTIPSQTAESILRDMNSLLASTSKGRPDFKYAPPRITLSRPIQKLPFDHPFVQRSASVAASVLGHAPAVKSADFWCDAALLGECGIPTIVFGPSGAGLHSREEWVEVRSIEQTAEILIRLVDDFCR